MADIGIDLGTGTTVVCHPRDGVVYDEPSLLVEWPARRGRELILGNDAAALDGRTPPGARTGRPVRGGAVTDLSLVRTYLHELLRRTSRNRWRVRRPHAVLSCPVDATPLERRALLEAAEEAGLGHADLLPAPLAGALGCGLDLADARVQAVADVGAGTAEIAVFCRGTVLTRRSCRHAGDEMTAAVRTHLREHHGLHLSEAAADALKVRASAAREPLAAEGRDVATGRPRVVTVEVAEIEAALAPVVRRAVGALADFLDDVPVAGIPDLLAGGVVLAGGSAPAPHLRDELEAALGVPVKVPDRPRTCVAEGLALAGGRPELRARPA
ncbi:rod shape-determining protein [Actinomycetospora cinnamomea]|uniref:Rod shape-determining protein MreB n=1 Tax=Actinomycetospora cinnamomea TaxID=663609 RepID=A0A2U1FDL9_9PSEU|nr:rod shape-determining protein [Actinomycetospora cinnamomea]PVZ10050.1 rod shape-determining protein MreB [Actinomycetospora cinnamomea]